MQFSSNIVSYAHLYGINNGLFVAASIITFIFATALLFSRHNQNLAKLFLLAGIAYLFLGAFNIYFQQFHFAAVTNSYHEAVLLIGKTTVPIALAIFTYLFVSETTITSKHAYHLVKKYHWVLTSLYLFDFIVFISMFFIESPKTAILIILLTHMPHILFGCIYAYLGLKDNTFGKIVSVLFLFSFIEYFPILWLVYNDMHDLPRSLVFLGHFFLASVTLVFSFVTVRFGYDQAIKYSNSSRSKQRRLMSDIDKAIKHDEFYLVYQPKLNIAENKVCGVEALIRWQHPKHGFIPPDEFITTAEQTHIIDNICKWVIVSAVKQSKSLHDDGYNLPISINFSVRNLNPDIVHFLIETMTTYQLPKESIIIEITETVFMQHSDEENKALKLLHQHGIALSLDDYGTGYSSLNSINQYALSEIKIDKTFVSNLTTQTENCIIVKSTLQMSKELGITVVAEGVEDDATLKRLADIHCTMAQGYGIAKPMIALDLVRWLRKSGYHYYYDKSKQKYST